MGQLIEIRESENNNLTLGRHRFRAWTERLSAEKTTTLYMSLLNTAGQEVSRWMYPSTGHENRRAAIDAVGQHLEQALRFCSGNDYRTYQVTNALRLAVEHGDDHTALSAAWKCIAELPDPVATRCWLFDGKDGHDILIGMRDLSNHINGMLAGVGRQDEGWSIVMNALSVEAIADDVRRAAESHPDFAPWADVLADSVAGGFDACKRRAPEPEPALGVRP